MVRKSKIPVQEMAARFRKCASACVGDVLDRDYKMGNQFLSMGIKPILPHMHVAGPAFTIFGARDPRNEEELPLGKFAEFGVFKAMYPGCVIVQNSESERHSGQWGEMMSYISKQHGATGVVIDGGIRDYEGLVRIPDWPVFVRYTSGVESFLRFRPVDMQVPIIMSGTLTAYVRVNPGDFVVGDADGVIVVPKEMAEEVLLKTEEMEVKEANTRRDLAAGVPIEEVYRRYGRL